MEIVLNTVIEIDDGFLDNILVGIQLLLDTRAEGLVGNLFVVHETKVVGDNLQRFHGGGVLVLLAAERVDLAHGIFAAGYLVNQRRFGDEDVCVEFVVVDNYKYTLDDRLGGEDYDLNGVDLIHGVGVDGDIAVHHEFLGSRPSDGSTTIIGIIDYVLFELPSQ